MEPPGAQIAPDSEFELRGDSKPHLHDGIGNVVEGTEVENPEVLALVPLPSPAERRLRDILLARLMLPLTGKTYSGPLEVGEDLMSIEIGEKVVVRRAPR